MTEPEQIRLAQTMVNGTTTTSGRQTKRQNRDSSVSPATDEKSQLFVHQPLHHIAIVRALPGLGDLLCTVPAWRALRAAWPEAHITLIGLPWAKSFVTRFRAYLDDFLEFPGFPGIKERQLLVQELPAFFAAVQGRFDLAIQMHGNGSISNLFTMLLGAIHTAGFYVPGNYCPDEGDETKFRSRTSFRRETSFRRFLPYPEDEPEIWRHLHLMAFLGVPLQGDQLEFPLTETDFDSLLVISHVHDLWPNEYVCIHPGASEPDRRWSPALFAAVADSLANEGFRVALTGTAVERPLTQAVLDAMQHKAINLAGGTDLGTLAALLNGARLLICNDTGVSHLGAALGIPSVVIFHNADTDRWAPLDRQRHRVVVDEGNGTITAVLDAAKSLLQETHHAVA